VGMLIGTFFTLLVVPCRYRLLAKNHVINQNTHIPAEKKVAPRLESDASVM